MNPKVELFSQGEEVVTGQVADTNAAWLSTQLVEMGFKVSRHTAVGDNLEDLVTLLKEISRRADCCICTGGLGPTVDDLTRDAVAKAFDAPLFFDEVALENINRFFKKRDMAMPDVNRQQAMFPEGATRIDNDWGTAPAFSFNAGQCFFIFLPGVPFEMRQLFNHKVRGELQQGFTLNPPQLVTLKTFGVGESDLQARLNEIGLPDEVELSFKAGIEENQIKLLFESDYPETDKRALVLQVADKLGDALFAIDGLDKKAGGLVDVISELLQDSGQKLALLETVSCGLMAAKCAGRDWFLESTVYATPETIVKKYAFIETHANTVANIEKLGEKLRQQTEADFVLLQFCNEGQTALNNQDENILLYNVLLTPDGICQQTKTLGGNLERKQLKAAMLGLDLLRCHLQRTQY